MVEIALERRNVLAHRGHWTVPAEKNSAEAIARALRAGYGLETDIRDLDGALVISHDPPRSGQGELLSFDWLCTLYAENDCDGVLALNIKADGLAPAIKATLDAHGIGSYFAFDMSVPDALAYKNLNMPFFTRVSEFEREPSLLDDAQGAWVDNFSGEFDQISAARKMLAAGKTVAFVSPELHGRDHAALWSTLLTEDWPAQSRIQICTDFPQACEDQFLKGYPL